MTYVDTWTYVLIQFDQDPLEIFNLSCNYFACIHVYQKLE